MLRKVLISLVVALPLLLVSFAVVMGFYAIVQAGKDETASRVLWWIAMSILMVTVTDLVALIGVLGLRAIEQDS